MAITKKTDKIAALRLEAGKLIGSGWAFNGPTINTLGADNQFPYISIDVAGMTEHRGDESIEGQAFQHLPILMQKHSEIGSCELVMRTAAAARRLWAAATIRTCLSLIRMRWVLIPIAQQSKRRVIMIPLIVKIALLPLLPRQARTITGYAIF